MNKYLPALVAAFALAASPATAPGVKKLRVIAAPGVATTKPKDWHNTLGVSGKDFLVQCPKCTPIQTITIPEKDVATLHYGQNAYHHWVSGIVSGAFSLGIGLIVGLMPHHQHFFSIDMKNGKVLAIQADKSDYKQIAGMLENGTGLPIEVTAKDAHYLAGFNTKVTADEKK
jgi:hypothetical protein